MIFGIAWGTSDVPTMIFGSSWGTSDVPSMIFGSSWGTSDEKCGSLKKESCQREYVQFNQVNVVQLKSFEDKFTSTFDHILWNMHAKVKWYAHQ